MSILANIKKQIAQDTTNVKSREKKRKNNNKAEEYNTAVTAWLHRASALAGSARRLLLPGLTNPINIVTTATKASDALKGEGRERERTGRKADVVKETERVCIVCVCYLNTVSRANVALAVYVQLMIDVYALTTR